mgnify:CR=1 FL=1
MIGLEKLNQVIKKKLAYQIQWPALLEFNAMIEKINPMIGLEKINPGIRKNLPGVLRKHRAGSNGWALLVFNPMIEKNRRREIF